MFTTKDGSAAVKTLALASMPGGKHQFKVCRKWTRQTVGKLNAPMPAHTPTELIEPMEKARAEARSAMHLRCHLCRKCEGI